MKITRIDQFAPAPRTRLVRIATDTGIEGWSESTLEGKPYSVPAAVSEYADYLVGKDPLLIEHHWQQMYRSAFFRGGAHNMTAIAALDAALWTSQASITEFLATRLWAARCATAYASTPTGGSTT